MLELTKKKIILHPFLFSVFLVIFIYSHNIFVIPVQEIIFPLLSILGITSVSFIILTLALKNARKSGLIVSLYLILFFSFGHVFNIVNDFSIGEFDIGRYSYLLILYFIIFVIGTIYLLKTKIELNSITKITNVVVITLLAVTSVSILITSINEPSFANEDVLQNINLHDVQETSQLQILNKKLPNVYYIILDEYGSQKSLQQFFNYDNKNFISFLKEKEFFVVENSYANYPTTKLSLGSSMNMKYLNYLTDSLGIESQNQHILDQIISENFVMQNFKSNGYDIINMGSLLGPNNEFDVADQNLCEQNYLFDRDSLAREVIETSMVGYLLERMVEDEIREVILCTFDKISEIKYEKPVFIFAHILLPHPPFIFGPNGENIVPGTSLNSKVWNPRDAYIDQLVFANKKTQESIEKILQNENGNAIIILQSDTGSAFDVDWDNPTREMIIERMSNLNAYYLPDKNYELFYDKLTPVNSFPLIFNSYFNQNYEIVDDKMYWSSGNQPYNFRGVTNLLLNDNE